MKGTIKGLRLCRWPECNTYFRPTNGNHIYCGSARKRTGCAWLRKKEWNNKWSKKTGRYWKYRDYHLAYAKTKHKALQEWRSTHRTEYNKQVRKRIQKIKEMFLWRFKYIPPEPQCTYKNYYRLVKENVHIDNYYARLSRTA